MPQTAAPAHTPPEVPAAPLDVLQAGIDSALGVVELITEAPMDAVNLAVGRATDAISQALPSFPAATMGMMAVALPHAHGHPPSLIPPAPPVPLPVIGTITLGCCVSVLINGVPAARAGDLGFSPTCCGFVPMFEVYTGSSKVFIGG
ncbi:MAG TPA: PAAR domain-containing protein, partial [Nannocystis sp.]